MFLCYLIFKEEEPFYYIKKHNFKICVFFFFAFFRNFLHTHNKTGNSEFVKSLREKLSSNSLLRYRSRDKQLTWRVSSIWLPVNLELYLFFKKVILIKVVLPTCGAKHTSQINR